MLKIPGHVSFIISPSKRQKPRSESAIQIRGRYKPVGIISTFQSSRNRNIRIYQHRESNLSAEFTSHYIQKSSTSPNPSQGFERTVDVLDKVVESIMIHDEHQIVSDIWSSDEQKLHE